jgi:uncharacterized membrane protein SpoIIM required for sporulation
MIENFIARRRARWERLSALLDRANSARHPLTVAELDELARLYRQATGDLAVARRDFPTDRATQFVNQLVARAHSILYREPPAPWRRLRDFFTRELPQEYRAAWPYLLAAAALFFGPLLAIAIAIVVAPPVAELVLSPFLLDDIKAGETWFDIDLPRRSAAASFIMTNNIQVSFMALAGGMLAGLGTILALVYNGLHIGSVAGALIAYGLADRLVGFVGPHGFMELSVIVVAGACGLMLGRAIVWADLRPRGQAVAAAGVRSVRLLLGVLPFMVAAGVLEGFVSPVAFPWPYKVAIGLATAVVMYSYLLLVGRRRHV